MLLKKSSSCCADRHGQDGSPFGLDGMITSGGAASAAVVAEAGDMRVHAVKTRTDAHSRLCRRRCRFLGSRVSIILLIVRAVPYLSRAKEL